MGMTYDVIVIGGGPAGLAAAVSAKTEGARTLLIEREEQLGGILKQCIHDGFGLMRFQEKLSGPEYAERFIDAFHRLQIPEKCQTFVTNITPVAEGFDITAVSRDGVEQFRTRTLILATGCRERTARQVAIHGTRPAGIYTAGTAQHFTNLLGMLPGKRCVILGSGDIGLIMARRLVLEGAEVLGVYEVKPEPSGLTRNKIQCPDDFGIPLHLSETVTRVCGDQRLTGVYVSRVDDKMQPIAGTERYIPCDTLILSVGLIPENEMAESLQVVMDPRTKGPVCDSASMTSVPGLFSCGNAYHVNDLVDYVSESGSLAGCQAARYAREGAKREPGITVDAQGELAYLVPQCVRREDIKKKIPFYFRSRRTLEQCELTVKSGEKTLFQKTFRTVRPPEMERIEVDLSGKADGEASLTVTLREVRL